MPYLDVSIIINDQWSVQSRLAHVAHLRYLYVMIHKIIETSEILVAK